MEASMNIRFVCGALIVGALTIVDGVRPKKLASE
jgi:hypothetical protein